MMWLQPWSVALLAICSAAAPARAQHPIVEIKVSGNQRLPAAAVIAASGLRKGQTATRAEMTAASGKLAATGFFTSVSYEYQPLTVGGVTGFDLTLLVTEDTALGTVELDFPGLDTEQLWRQLKSADGLVDRKIPNNDRAAAYFKHVLEGVLRKANHPEEIAMKTEANLGAGKMMSIFRPAHLSRVATIRFEGNAAIPNGRLQAAMAKVAIGQDYSERDFRRLLEFNVRPLYEELGRLTVAFPRVNMAPSGDGAVAVTAAIDEGPVWRLGKVGLAGDHLPLADMHEAVQFEHGSPANWPHFVAGVNALETVLRRDGYINVHAKPVRSFREAERMVDVTVEFTKGIQYRFGELLIEGLDPNTRQRLAGLWKLPAGAPMNQPYIDEFVKASLPVLRNKFRTFNSELHVRPGVSVVDVTLKFQ